MLDEEVLRLLPDRLTSYLTPTERHSQLKDRRIALVFEFSQGCNDAELPIVCRWVTRAFCMTLKRMPAYAGKVQFPPFDYPTWDFKLTFANAWKKPDSPYLVRRDLVSLRRFEAGTARISSAVRSKLSRGLIHPDFFPDARVEETKGG